LHSTPPLVSRHLLPPPISPLFPYTTLFRSHPVRADRAHERAADGPHINDQREQNRQLIAPAVALRRLQHHVERQRKRQPGDSNRDRKSTRLNSSHVSISYAVFCLKKTTGHT